MSTSKEKIVITVNKEEFVEELMKNNKIQIKGVPKPRKRISDLKVNDDYFVILDGKVITLSFTNSNFDRDFIQADNAFVTRKEAENKLEEYSIVEKTFLKAPVMYKYDEDGLWQQITESYTYFLKNIINCCPDSNYKDNFAEKIADIEIALLQLKEILGLDPIDISKIKIAKARKEKELKINDGV